MDQNLKLETSSGSHWELDCVASGGQRGPLAEDCEWPLRCPGIGRLLRCKSLRLRSYRSTIRHRLVSSEILEAGPPNSLELLGA